MSKRIKKLFCRALGILLVLPLLFGAGSDLATDAQASLKAAYGELSADDYASVMTEPAVQTSAATLSMDRATLKSLRLYPGGIPFGIKFITDGVLVVGFCDVNTGSSKAEPSSDAGLRVGDRIVAVNGKKLSSAEELSAIVEQCGGKALSLTYTRDGRERSTSLTPIFSKRENCYKSGLYVKDNGAGIGTVSYIVPNSLEFGGLGHGVCEGESGALMPIARGSVCGVGIDGVVRGQSGTPGELRGHFKAGKSGTLLKNSDCGVFGIFAKLPQGLPSEPLPLGLRDEIREGRAYIWSTLDGSTPQKYEIEISNINTKASAGKCFTVKITDEKLLQKSGGIVQGMSGSPIIQNGKLVGAVTHVLINDPTTGYGIFIENMLAAGQTSVMPRAA